MGDRANVKLTENGEAPIYLYTHWSGSEWPEELRKALAFGKGRWGDAPYLNRILASRMFLDLVDGETGGGISTYIGDNGWPIIVLDNDKQTVHIEPEEGGDPLGRVFTFQEYVDQPDASWNALGVEE